MFGFFAEEVTKTFNQFVCLFLNDLSINVLIALNYGIDQFYNNQTFSPCHTIFGLRSLVV